MNSETKTCQNCNQSFQIEPEDFAFYDKIQVPPPTFCPECRLVRRMNFKNERGFHKRKCDLCDKSIIAIYPPNSTFPVYCPQCWWSDKWDAPSYGVDYNFSKPFFQQIKELLDRMPRISLLVDYLRMINSEYANYTGPLKNCYLLIQSEQDENCFYSSSLFGSKDSADCLRAGEVEKAYELFNCQRCYNAFFSVHCFECMDIYFSKDLRNCQDCFGCVGLRNKQYYIFNQPHSKTEYLDFIKNINVGSFSEIKIQQEKARQFWVKFPNKYNTNGLFNVNVSGDYITSSKNVFNSFEISGGENLKHCFQAHMPTSKDCYDYGDWGNNASLMYESINCGENISNSKFSFGSWIARDLQYCDTVVSSDYMFGCSQSRKRQYCILNKQYTKESFDELRTKIIEHMNSMPYIDSKGITYKYGEFFPTELSPFAYNETIAQEYFPLTKQQAIDKGYQWKDPEERNIQTTIKSEDLPDHIKDVKDDIIKEIIECQHAGSSPSTSSGQTAETVCNEQCTKAFKIIPQELEFYKKMNLPLPRLCPNCRHYQRLKQRNPLKLWKRQCQCSGEKSSNGIYTNTISHHHGHDSCQNEFETSYHPDRPEIVYCEQCYNQEVA